MLTKNSVSNAISHIFQDTIFYAVVNTLSRSAHLFIFPVLSRGMEISDFGLHELLYAAMNILVTLVILGIESAVFRFYFDDPENSNRTVTSGLVFITISSVSVAIFLAYFIDYLHFFEQFDSYFITCASYALLSLPFAAIYAYSEAICRIQRQRTQFLVLNLGYAFSIALSIFLLNKFGPIKLDQLFLSYMLIWLIMSSIGIYFIRSSLVLTFTIPSKKFFEYGIPICLSSVVISLSPVIERTLILMHDNTETLGSYSAVSKIAMIYLLPINAFNIAFLPFAMKNFQKNIFAPVMNSILIVAAMLLLCGIVWVSPFSEKILVLFASEKYSEVSMYLVPLLFAVMLQFISGVLSIGLLLGRKTHLKLIITAFSILALVLSLDVFIPKFGIQAVVYSLLAVRIFTSILEFIAAQKTYHLEWNSKILGCLILYLAFTYCVCQADFYKNSQSIIMPIGLTCSALVFIALSWFCILRNTETEDSI